MTQSERINLLKKEIPKMKEEIIDRSRNTVKGCNYVWLDEDLNIHVAEVDDHFRTRRLIHFRSGQFTEKGFQADLKEAISQESQYVEVQ